MPDSELAVVSVDSFATPTIITRAGPTTRKKFFEFFTVPIRNADTRAAYYRAIQQFLTWAERAGYQDLEDIEPITVAAYIETLQRQAAPPTVKQHMAAIRMLFSWLTEKGVLAMNPAREVKTERFSRTEGKTPPSSKARFRSFWARLRHPRTRACAIALCSGSLPTLSPGSAPS
jgi:integrase/recombinase XerD